METIKPSIELVSMWERAYQKMNGKDQRERLNDLLTWDFSRNDDKHEYLAKITALRNLLSTPV